MTLRTTLAFLTPLFLALPLPGMAQTILNTERFQLREVDGFHLSADLTLSLQRGNRELLDLTSSGMVGTLRGRHWTRLIFGGKYLSSSSASLLDQQYAQLRYSYVLSPETQSFHFIQLQRNETLLLRSRLLLGSGIRRALLSGDRLNLEVGTGIMGEWEELSEGKLGAGDDPSAAALRMANLAVLTVDFAGGARLLNIVYLQPDLSDFGDLRLLNDLGLSVPISSRVRSTVSLEWRRDSRPPSVLRGDDLSLRAGMGIDLR